MRRRIPEIQAKNADFFAIGNGTIDHLRWFVEDQRADFPVFTDPKLAAYRAAGFKRGMLEVAGPRALANVAAALSRGYKNRGPMKGDSLQMGGALVIQPDGTVRFRHQDQRWGDHVSVDAILNVLS